MTRANRAVRLSPLAFALAFGAYSENFSASRGDATAPDPQETVAPGTERGKHQPPGTAEA